ncbi:MAG: hypothetical protein WBG04_20230 [Haloferula sp.]
MKSASPAHAHRSSLWLAAFSFGMVAIASSQIINPLDKEEEDDEGLPAMEMLIEGSVLQGVMMPQYDESRRLTSVVRAAKLTMVNRGLVNAETLRIDFYNPDRSPKGRIDLVSAHLEDQKILRSTDPVSLVSDELNLNGSGLVYDLKGSRGFLNGPAEAKTLIENQSAMKSSSKTRSVVAGAMIAAAAGTQAEEPGKLSEKQLIGLNNLAASVEDDAAAAAKEAAESLEKSDAQSKQADETLGEFLTKAAVDVPKGKIPDLSAKVPDPEFPSGKQLATFSADDGIYFDSENALLVFLKNVKARHPEFTLDGADEVKVFFDKKKDKAGNSEPEKIDEEEAGKLLGGSSFGDPSKIVATGTIVIEKIKTDPGDKSAKASGRQIVYDFKTNEVIIRGGQPWIISDSVSGQVVDPNGYIRMNVNTGDGETFGKTEGLVKLKEKK